jgi:sarcosine oxidase gamma subunit
MAIELKTANGKLSDAQKTILRRMGENGWHIDVVRSFEEFLEVIR